MLNSIQNNACSFMDSLELALKDNLQVKLEPTTKEPILRPLRSLERLVYIANPAFHNNRLSAITDYVTTLLHDQARLSLDQASKDGNLIIGRKFVKFLKSQKNNLSSDIDNLSKEITAGKLGITKEQLEANPYLQEFTEKHYLERYLLHFEHTLQIDSETGKILIKEQGSFVPWDLVAEKIKNWRPRLTDPCQYWFYGKEGIQQKNMYDWETLTPYKIEDPSSWNHQYIFEICACYNPDSTKIGNHSWFRLRTPKGEVFSIGLYRPIKGLSSNLNTPFRAKPGHLIQPDVSEFWNSQITTLPIQITESFFNEMKRTIERDKAENKLIFHLNNSNCLLYCKKIGAIAKISLPTEEPISSFIFPKGIITLLNYVTSYLPETIRKIVLTVPAFFLNTTQLLLGANCLDANLNEEQKKQAVPLITSFLDIFNFQKTIYNHPITFIQKTKEIISQWRAEQIENLCNHHLPKEELEEKTKELMFALPRYCKQVD